MEQKNNPANPDNSKKEILKIVKIAQEVVDTLTKRKTPQEKTAEFKRELERSIFTGLPFLDKYRNKTDHKEGFNKYKSVYTFPTGLKLTVAKDDESLELWENPEKSPTAIFQKEDYKANLKDVPPAVRAYIENEYTDNVPLFKIQPEDLEKPISAYFKLKELLRIDSKDKEKMEEKGQGDVWEKYEKHMILHKDGNYYWNVARIDPNLCRTLDAVRKLTLFPVQTDEGVRPKKYNSDMYRVLYDKDKSSSPHISGRAVDLKRTGDPEKDRILLDAIKEVLKPIGGGIGYGDTIYHIDVIITKANWFKKPVDGELKELNYENGKLVLRTRDWKY